MAKTFAQKWLSRRLGFSFEDDSLRIDFEDASEAVSFHVPYAEIPFESRRYTEKMEALRGVAILMGVIAIFTAVSGIGDVSRLVVAGVQIGVAGLAFAGYQRLRATFTLVDTERGRITVLDDAHHDTIMGEIETRRREVLRDMLASVDPDNDPVHEGRKFEWLHRNGVISDDEFHSLMEEVGMGERPALTNETKTVH